MRLRLDEVDCESPREIGRKEKTEGSAFGMRVAVTSAEGEGEQGKEENSVELGGVSGIPSPQSTPHGRWVDVPKEVRASKLQRLS